VKGAFRGDANLIDLSGRMYETAQAMRRQAPALEGPWNQQLRSRASVSGLRVITVWNASGGAGKTTVATNLAYEAATRGLRTLLVCLGAPDDTPMILGLEPEPNVGRWPADPTPDGLKGLVQRLGDLDVIVGFRSVVEESTAGAIPPENPGSIPNLVMTAAYQGYAVIVLDAPPCTTAPLAIMAANTLLLVARPTAADAHRTLEAVRTVLRHLAGRHRVAPSNIYIVLNQGAAGDYGPDEWHRLLAVGCKQAGLAAPPVAVSIPNDPAVRTAQNNARLAMQVSDELARGIHVLAEALFGGEAVRKPKEEGRRFKIGSVGIRIKK
jgi:cellulose biosynthesis protein BcsQ